jgi:hypothetical protein
MNGVKHKLSTLSSHCVFKFRAMRHKCLVWKLKFVIAGYNTRACISIICFKMKNLPTLHSTSKIQPTTSLTFVFNVSANVRKKWGYERKLLTVVLVVVLRVFYTHFMILLKRYDMVATTFLHIIIILC